MLVQRVLLPGTRRESWTVLGDDGPVQPIERYLAYLADIERSPNTVKAYAHDLKDWFVFLAEPDLDFRAFCTRWRLPGPRATSSRAAVRPLPAAAGRFPRARGSCPQCPPGSTQQLPGRGPGRGTGRRPRTGTGRHDGAIPCNVRAVMGQMPGAGQRRPGTPQTTGTCRPANNCPRAMLSIRGRCGVL
jgi:hypothetical protein